MKKACSQSLVVLALSFFNFLNLGRDGYLALGGLFNQALELLPLSLIVPPMFHSLRLSCHSNVCATRVEQAFTFPDSSINVATVTNSLYFRENGEQLIYTKKSKQKG